MSISTRIAGTGSYLPPRRVSNDDMVALLAKRGIETSHEWIVERTGIHARRFADEGVLSSDLGVQAALAAIKAARKQVKDIDLIVVATSTPDMMFPSTATLIQNKLGISGCAAFDVQAVCSGFIYGMTITDAMLRTGAYRCALLIGAEVFSRILNFDDRSTCVLFGDGAGAMVLEASNEPGILASELHADGHYHDILSTPAYVGHGRICGVPFLQMNGRAVFKQAVNALQAVSKSVLDKAHMTIDDVDWMVPHQANIRIMQSTAKHLGMSEERVFVTVNEHGNTSAASIPLAFDQAVRTGQLQRGQTVFIEGVGGGLTWGAILLKY